MAKVSYANLKLKTNTEVKTINVNGTDIDVLQYLPTSDKYDLCEITIQKAGANSHTLINPVLLDMYLNLNIVYLYTNLNFTEKQREDECKLYDTLLSTGVIDMIIDAIPEEEYHTIFDYVQEYVNQWKEYSVSTAAIISKFIDDLPANAEAARAIVDNFDKDKYQSVVDFAKAANGGRNIE